MSVTHTDRYALPAPNGDDPIANGDNVIRESMALVDAIIATGYSGTFAGRPAAGKLGRFYYSNDAGTLGFDTGSEWVTVGRADRPMIPVVTDLPASPDDGQLVAYAADPIRGELWTLRYRAASASVYKWEFAGGSPLHAEQDASELTSSTTYTNLSSVGPTITVPLDGDYFIDIGTDQEVSSSAAMSYQIGDDTPLDADRVLANVARRRRKIGLVAGDDVVAKYRSLSGADMQFAHRYVSLTPVRVRR